MSLGNLVSIAVIICSLLWGGACLFKEEFSSLGLLIPALGIYFAGARYYSGFISKRVLKLDDSRITPAHRFNDGFDYIPYRRWTLFGMHFAWIAGPGPLIGPTLAAQFGYLPSFLWIVLGAVFLGCVQDMVILVFSTRRNGLSLARMFKNEVGPEAGFIASFAILLILVILLGVLALFVVNALKDSPWGTFTIAASIPIAFFVGWYMTRLRPGHEGEATLIGVILLIAATALGRFVALTPALARCFTFTDSELAVIVVIYGFLAATLPAWMLLAPRDNVSTYLKIGTVFLLALGIVIAQPVVKMPPVTQFVDGSGPIFGGDLFPFCFIIIACGAISGFHSLISSGTTPRLVDKESDIRVVAYGAMLTESFVGVMALIAAVTLSPGVYLAMNIPPRAEETAVDLTSRISSYGELFRVSPEEMNALAVEVHETSLYNRSGGGPSLAVGMARIFSNVLSGEWAAFWYHFAIMFEAVFILTVLDSGTRVIRFVVNEMLRDLKALGLRRRRRSGAPKQKAGSHYGIPTWLSSLVAVLSWGFVLSWGIVDREGGTKALIKMFGTANQLLSVIALVLATVVMLKHYRRFVWVTAIPALVVGAITITSAIELMFSSDVRVGALAGAYTTGSAAALQNAWLMVLLTGLLLLLVFSVLGISFRKSAAILLPGRDKTNEELS